MIERDRCITAVNMLRQVMQKSFTTQPEMFVSSREVDRRSHIVVVAGQTAVFGRRGPAPK